MRIEYQCALDKQVEQTIEDFADEHGLTMLVVLRFPPATHGRTVFARFKNVEVKEGHLLASAAGFGDTQAEAINDYAQRISEQLLVVDAYGTRRRLILAPRFV